MSIQRYGRHFVGACFSSSVQRLHSRRQRHLQPGSVLCAILILVSCSCGASAVRESVRIAPPPTAEFEDSNPSTTGGSLISVAALRLLNLSVEDSCAVCARRHREEAFEILDQSYPPGTLFATTEDMQLLRIPGDENELSFTTPALEGPTLTFRFHSEKSHLIGIADSDRTDEAVIQNGLGVAGEGRLVGLLELVGYAYGDGLTFLYSPSRNHLQFQCKILDISPE